MEPVDGLLSRYSMNRCINSAVNLHSQVKYYLGYDV